MTMEMWAVAAVAVIDAAGSPLIMRTYTSPPAVLTSPQAPQQAHLYVGPEDIIKIHFLLFSSLDRLEERWAANRQRLRSTASAKQQQQQQHLTSATTSAHPSAITRGVSSRTTGPLPLRAAPTSSSPPASAASVAGTNTDNSPSVGNSQQQPRLVTSATDVRFMGRLVQSHRFVSYGFCSATGVRTVLVTVGAAEAPPDAMLPLCRAIYEAASAAMCNPFRTPSLCHRTQQALLARSEQQLLAAVVTNSREGGGGHAAPAAGTVVDTSAAVVAAVHSTCAFMANGAAGPPLLLQPMLALSETFNRQLASIVSSYTVMTLSCIMH